MKKLSLKKRDVIALAAGVLAVATSLAVLAFIIFVPLGDGLGATPKTTRVPTFATNATAVPGWAKVANAGLEQDVDEVPYVTYKNSAKTCTFITTTVLYPSYLANRGDYYLSKFALYQLATQDQQLVKNELDTASLPTADRGPLGAVSGQWATTSSTYTSKRDVWAAARAIDTLYKRPPAAVGDSSGNPFGTDESKGIPVLTATYSCAFGKGSTAEFDKLLAAVKVNLR